MLLNEISSNELPSCPGGLYQHNVCAHAVENKEHLFLLALANIIFTQC
jgi:hypothetical protein